MPQHLLADGILAIHFLWVLFLTAGFPVILFINRNWLRLIHAGGLVTALLMQIAGIYCPLTIWEERMSPNGLSPAPPRSFLLRLIEDFIYIDSQNIWIISLLTVLLLACVALSFWLRPLRKSRR
ncbi:MAG: DUF2784 family protein [Deltaproteobacteria bacterium]|nr:DUF2784 family protein [Deltaproteobacteria bacterium]